jgi:N-acetylglucosamine-6-phosphate deacetylase
MRMASLTPAERVGMEREIGSLEGGKRADVLVLDQKLTVQRVFIDGQEFAIDERPATD